MAATGYGSDARSPVSGELIERCRRGDRDAQRELFERTVDDVDRILLRLVGPVADRADLVQESYLALWRALPKFRGEARFSTFLFGICLRVAKRRARGWARWRRLQQRAAREPSGPPPATPGDRLEAQQRAAAVHRALDRLSFKLRTVLVLYEMEGLSGKQIAERLGIPDKTVWTRLHSARKAFRRVYRWPPKTGSREPAPG